MPSARIRAPGFWVSVLRLVLLALVVGSWTLAAPGVLLAAPVDVVETDQYLPLEPYLELLEDPERSYRPEQLFSGPLSEKFVAAVDSIPSKGMSESAWWVRIELNSLSDRELQRTVSVAWPRLERVDFYDLRPEGIRHLRSGWLVPFDQRPVADPAHLFPVQLAPRENRIILLRIESQSELLFPVRLFSPEGRLARERIGTGGRAFILGVLATMVLFSLVLFTRLRASYHLQYAIAVAAFGVWWFFNSGWIGAFDSVVPVGQSVTLFALLSWTFFRAAFARSFLETSYYAPRSDRALSLIQFVGVPLVACLLLLPVSGALCVLVGVLLQEAQTLLALSAGVVAWRAGSPRARAFTIAYAIFALGFTIGNLILAGGIALNPAVAGMTIMFGTLLEAIVLSMALAGDMLTVTAQRQQALAQVQTERLESLRALVAGVTHEMNSPLGSLNSNADSLSSVGRRLEQALAEDEPDRGALARVQKVLPRLTESTRTATDRIDTIVGALKNFSRLDESEQQVADLHEGVDAALVLLASRMGNRIAIKKTYGELPKIMCRPGQLNQVFMHLLTNSIAAIEKEGTIEVITRQDGDELEVAIVDDGRGMSRGERERAFVPRLTSKGERVRMGLGLSTSLGVVQDHGGTLALESELGRGTRAVLRLPLAPPGS